MGSYTRSTCLALVTLLWLMQYNAKTTHCALTSTTDYVNATVAQDKSGDFTTVTDALKAAPRNRETRYVIRIKPGTYNERVEVESDMTFITLIGDDVAATTITFDRSNATGFKTIDTGTLSVKGRGFVAKSLTIKNSAGPDKHQAAALYNGADETAFHNCRFLGNQDTLYAHQNRQFYKDCDISGTVDFIFGHASAVFQDCRIFAGWSTTVTVTAQDRQGPSEVGGFSFQNCTVGPSPFLKPPQKDLITVFLGRPWSNYSTVIFMQSFLDGVVDPRGWTEWPGNVVDLLYFAEYENRGPGADTSKRVNWPGYHVLKDWRVADRFTVAKLIDGNSWLPQTGVPYRAGLRN